MSLSRMNRRLSLPTGTETLRLQEVLARRRAAQALEELFRQWAYLPAETPMVDYFEVYRRLLPEESSRATYRILDRAGEVLMVRSDTTLFLAKQLGIHLQPDELPIRVYYNEQILRHQVEHNISKNEYQQAGIELVGVRDSDGDVEVLLLLAEALITLGAKDPVIHVGTHGILRELVQIGVPSEQEPAIREALRLRDRRKFRASLAPYVPSTDNDAIEHALFSIFEYGDSETESVMAAVPRQLLAPIHRLDAVLKTVTALHSDVRFRIDLSEVGQHDYYTGTAFAAYTTDSDDAIARGGRYDDLLGSFGFDAPSVGFSIYTRKLCPIVEADGARPRTVQASGETFLERYEYAKKERAAGKAVQL